MGLLLYLKPRHHKALNLTTNLAKDERDLFLQYFSSPVSFIGCSHVKLCCCGFQCPKTQTPNSKTSTSKAYAPSPMNAIYVGTFLGNLWLKITKILGFRLRTQYKTSSYINPETLTSRLQAQGHQTMAASPRHTSSTQGFANPPCRNGI